MAANQKHVSPYKAMSHTKSSFGQIMSPASPKTQSKLKAQHLVIENYKLGEKLGKGAYSTVYKGLNVSTGQFVAIKRLKRKKVAEEALMAEVNLLKELRHENIVRYIDVVMSESHINLVLDYIESGSLASVVEKFGVFPEPLVAMYMEQVLQGLDYLHSNKIIHRDIKGPNLLITKEGVIKLADFGIAIAGKTAEGVAPGGKPNHILSTSVVEGSPFWMAPEVIQMSDKVTTAADIWSLGCTIIELISGFPPYYDNSGITALFRMVEDEHPPFPEDISDDLAQFLVRCFQKDATKRPTPKELAELGWIAKAAKVSKKKSWGDTLNKVKKYNTKRRTATLNSLSITNMDWNQLQSDISTELDKQKPGQPQAQPQQQQPPAQQASPNPTETPHGKLHLGHKTKSLSLDHHHHAIVKPEIPDNVQFTVTITGSEKRSNFLYSYTVYRCKVAVTAPKEAVKCWVVYRSYSDFSDLDVKLRNFFQRDIPANFAELPKMKWFGNMEPAYVNYLVGQLRDYLKKLLGMQSSALYKIMLTWLSFDEPDKQIETTLEGIQEISITDTTAATTT